MTDFLSASQHETYFKIYSSSAGSGKTYTLAKEYIKLALRSKSPWYFNHILAVTFTNKAAGEMKERILKYLRIFSSNDPQEQATEQGLFNQILEELQQEGIEIDEVTLRARASATFKHIIHEYANFSVSTIDSFVQRVVSAFTEELGFPFNFEVNLDSEVLLDAAVEQLLQKLIPKPTSKLRRLSKVLP
jgi:ATP-dependent exoDNAse (exonuclease V) beta subunit